MTLIISPVFSVLSYLHTAWRGQNCFPSKYFLDGVTWGQHRPPYLALRYRRGTSGCLAMEPDSHTIPVDAFTLVPPPYQRILDHHFLDIDFKLIPPQYVLHVERPADSHPSRPAAARLLTSVGNRSADVVATLAEFRELPCYFG